MKGRGKGNEWLIIKKRDAFAAAGLGRGGARLQRALRPHTGGNRAEPAGAESQAEDRRRGRSRLGKQPAGEARRPARRRGAKPGSRSKKKSGIDPASA